MIAIPNMEIPRTCYECDSDFASSFGCEEWWGWVFPEGKEKRSPDCPLIDIVTCGECKHSKEWYRDKRICNLWSDTGVSVFEDGFCSYGERRSDEHNT